MEKIINVIEDDYFLSINSTYQFWNKKQQLTHTYNFKFPNVLKIAPNWVCAIKYYSPQPYTKNKSPLRLLFGIGVNMGILHFIFGLRKNKNAQEFNSVHLLVINLSFYYFWNKSRLKVKSAPSFVILILSSVRIFILISPEKSFSSSPELFSLPIIFKDVPSTS